MNTLVIGDTHFPYEHPRYLDFILDVHDEIKPDRVVHIGDVVDWASVTFHQRSPEIPSAVQEYETALQRVQKWKSYFPRMTVLIGNHDARIQRKLHAAEVPERFLRSFSDIWDTPLWCWKLREEIDGVLYQHGDGVGGGNYPAFNTMKKLAQSTVLGHNHSQMGIKWMANHNARFFGMDVGCGIDQSHIAFQYHHKSPMRFMLGAGAVRDGVGIHFPMQCGPGEKYARKRKRGRA